MTISWPDLRADWEDNEYQSAADFNQYALRINDHSTELIGVIDAFTGDLAAIAALTPTNNDVLQRKSGAWTNRTMAQLKTDLSLAKADVGLGSVDNTSDTTKWAATVTLTNKTLNLASNTLTGTTAQFNTALSDGDFVTLNGTETLTNKTLTSPTINTPAIANATSLSVGTSTNSGTTTPKCVNLGGTFGTNTAGTSGNQKINLLNDGTNVWGIGVGNDRIEYQSGSGTSHRFYIGGVEALRIFGGSGTGLQAFGVDMVSTTAAQSLSSKTLSNPTVTGYTESVVAIGNTGTAKTISLASGTVQTATLTGNCTFTMPTATTGTSFVLYLKTGTGGFTATFTGVKWPAGTAPTITTTASRMDILSFVADGTNWYGSYTQNYTP